MASEVGAARPKVIVVMGVSGSGKTTVALLLARTLGWRFADADRFHSAGSRAKMRRGIALGDRDRRPWLRRIARQIDVWRRCGTPGVVACSALKRRYRAVLIGPRRDVRLVYLRGDRALIGQRLAARRGHFMPASLLRSQFAALEEPRADERPVTVGIDDTPPDIVAAIVAELRLTAASR